MITDLAARWALTAVFAAAGLIAALPRRGPAAQGCDARATVVGAANRWRGKSIPRP